MTETEKKALAMVNEACKSDFKDLGSTYRNNLLDAILRAIEQHEAFKLEVSDAVEKALYQMRANQLMQAQVAPTLTRFIVAKPDEASAGLALAIEDTLELVIGDGDVSKLRAALAARGLEVRKIGEGE